MVIKSFLIHDFIRRIKISESRRKVYYTKVEGMPQRFLKNPERYQLIDGKLFDHKLGENVVKNKKTAGTPRYHKISGNEIWTGVNHHLRTKIASEMKKYFYEHFRGTEPLKASDYPIGISIRFIDNLFGRDGEDIDNMVYFYRKTIHDALCGNVEFSKVPSTDKPGKFKFVPMHDKHPPIIEDDDRSYILETRTKLICMDIPDEETSILIEIYKL
jgi:hypothetical protein